MRKVQLGKINALPVEEEVEFGIYLTGDDKVERILLPKKQVPDGTQIGDVLEVFIYRDSDDRLIATTKMPYAQVGEVAHLEVVEKTRIGAFVNIGLERDVLLPHSEQPYNIQEGRKYLMKLYVDISERLCATAKIDGELSADSPYNKGDFVKGVVYKTNEEIGVFVAVENKYYGLIPKNENFSTLRIGDEVELRVIRVREDGKLDVSPRKVAHEQMQGDAEVILDLLQRNNGFLPLHDKSDPEVIKQKLKMSKAAFKRAVGGLMKQQKITQDEKGIHLV